MLYNSISIKLKNMQNWIFRDMHMGHKSINKERKGLLHEWTGKGQIQKQG